MLSGEIALRNNHYYYCPFKPKLWSSLPGFVNVSCLWPLTLYLFASVDSTEQLLPPLLGAPWIWVFVTWS